MREHKGWGRSRARKNRIARDEVRETKFVAPVHMRDALKGPSEEGPKKIVITQNEVDELASELNGWKTGRKRRKIAEVLRFERRENWT